MNNKNVLEEDFFYSRVIKNLEKFNKTSGAIITNYLLEVEDKGDIRDIFGWTS